MAEIAQLKAEARKAKADRKAKLQSRIDSLEQKLQNQRAQAKQRSDEIKKEQEAKLQTLEKKADNSRGEAKKAFHTRAMEIRESYEKGKAKWQKLELEKATERYQKTKAKLEKMEVEKGAA